LLSSLAHRDARQTISSKRVCPALSICCSARQENGAYMCVIDRIELAKALLAIGAETDVVCKLLVKIRLGKEVDNMGECRKLIPVDLPEFPDWVVDVPRYGLQLKPWSAWREGRQTQWWRAYTGLKHDRSGAFTQANFGNVLEALTALFIAVLLYLKSVGVDAIAPFPALLRPPPQLGGVVTESRNGLIIDLRVK